MIRRKVETWINEQANYTAQVEVEGTTHTLHFMALFSERKDAIPIIFCNGWPSCFLEFLPLLEHVREQYSAKDLPYVVPWVRAEILMPRYHLIIPSLPGYAFSSKPPIDKEFQMADVAKCYGELMKGLGFDSYIGQGSDIGGSVMDYLSDGFLECKSMSEL